MSKRLWISESILKSLKSISKTTSRMIKIHDFCLSNFHYISININHNRLVISLLSNCRPDSVLITIILALKCQSKPLKVDKTSFINKNKMKILLFCHKTKYMSSFSRELTCDHTPYIIKKFNVIWGYQFRHSIYFYKGIIAFF